MPASRTLASPELLDALAEAVAARLAEFPARGLPGPIGPIGEPDAELPPGWRPLPQPDTGGIGQVGARVGIDGIEYTQSTQYNSTVTRRYGDDNAVPLVAWKTLVVRAYPSVRRGRFGADTLTDRPVSGELVLSVGDRVLYRTGPTRSGGARIGAPASLSRTLWDREFTVFDTGGLAGLAGLGGARAIRVNSPLNFVVPAYYCRPGRIHATLHVWPVDDGPMSARDATRTEYLWFNDVPVPKVCLVRVNWSDANGTLYRPSDAAMLGTLALAGRMLPFPYFEATILGTEVSSSAAFAMLAQNGGCNTAWSGLVTELNVTRIFTALFQLGDIVYGLVPTAAIPPGTGKYNSGCGRGAGGGFLGDGLTLAHEFGHLYGRPHVAVAGDPGNDSAYPNYGGSATSIGECGIDTGTSPPTLYDPQGSDELMSYGNNQWISPYTYQKIFDARALHQTAPVDPSRLRPLLVLDFRVHRALAGATRVELKALAHVQAAGHAPLRPADAPSPLSIDLLDGNRRVLATHHCRYVPAHGGGRCGCCAGGEVPLEREPWLDFSEVVEWLPEGGVAAIAFHRGGEPFHVVEVGEAPLVWIEAPLAQDDGRLLVRLGASHPRERVSLLLLYSADDAGRTWQLVALDPPNGEVLVDPQTLPGGDACRFRALGSAELQSVGADTEPFVLPRQPRRLHLDLPDGPCPLAAGPVALAAHIDCRGLGAPAPQEIEWRSSLDGPLGFGYTITPLLGEGRHEISVGAPDGLGGRLEQRGTVTVGARTA